jgi:hypothetical protein
MGRLFGANGARVPRIRDRRYGHPTGAVSRRGCERRGAGYSYGRRVPGEPQGPHGSQSGPGLTIATVRNEDPLGSHGATIPATEGQRTKPS